MRSTFKSIDIAAQLSGDIGMTVDTGYIYKAAHDCWPEFKGKFGDETFTLDFKVKITEYAVTWYHKTNAPSFSKWLSDTGKTRPARYIVPEIVPAKSIKSPKKDAHGEYVTIEQLHKIINTIESKYDKKTKELEKQITSKPVKLIADTTKRETRENDPRLADINKKVTNFVMQNNISAQITWVTIRQLFAKKNGLNIELKGNQSFPQWTRSNNYIDLFETQLQGILDTIYDRLVKQPPLQF
jgi:hypothetical protein